MRTKFLNDIFIEAAQSRVPEGTKLTSILMDILSIEKEAVYRRLRGEVPFSFVEIVTISNHLGLSLDNIIKTSENSRPISLSTIDYLNPTEMDYVFTDQFLDILEYTVGQSYSEYAEATNMLPESLYYDFEYLNRFFFFKWNYHWHFGPQVIKSYHEIKVPERLRISQFQHAKLAKEFKETTFVWDLWIFLYLINDIKSFATLNIIKEEDVKLIKEDLFKFLSYIENIAVKGKFEESGNNVHIYISETNLETSYGYMESENYKMSLMKTFTTNNIGSMDHTIFITMKEMVQSYKRLSNMISVSGEKSRLQFFSTQRNLVETL